MAVQELEQKLEIQTRWTPEDEEWQWAAGLVVNREYQGTLDNLEGLIVACIFELTRMNRAGTGKSNSTHNLDDADFRQGYKMRKHIGKALQTRSSAIRTALDRYNTAARAMSPPRRTLEWDEVVEYAFLADFDLFCDVRQDISQRPWATPGDRHAMDMYFKMCRAKEEIRRLNIEICCFTTYLQDEERYLQCCIENLEPVNPAIAHQVTVFRNIHGRFNDNHLKCLMSISQLPGFLGTLLPSKSIYTG
jgi:hypothetical protein